MNEKVAKKIGEAYAFSQNLHTLAEHHSESLGRLLGDHAGDVTGHTRTHIQTLTDIADSAGMKEVVVTKADKTDAKIAKMANMYVGDEWDNPVEVLEWLSFFLGGAIVHWQLIHGSAEAMEHARLAEVAEQGVTYYEGLMEAARNSATRIGKERASA